MRNCPLAHLGTLNVLSTLSGSKKDERQLGSLDDSQLLYAACPQSLPGNGFSFPRLEHRFVPEFLFAQ